MEKSSRNRVAWVERWTTVMMLGREQKQLIKWVCLPWTELLSLPVLTGKESNGPSKEGRATLSHPSSIWLNSISTNKGHSRVALGFGFGFWVINWFLHFTFVGGEESKDTFVCLPIYAANIWVLCVSGSSRNGGSEIRHGSYLTTQCK